MVVTLSNFNTKMKLEVFSNLNDSTKNNFLYQKKKMYFKNKAISE